MEKENSKKEEELKDLKNKNNERKSKKEIKEQQEETIDEGDKTNIYLIFTINKDIYDKNEINIRILNYQEQNTNLIRIDESKDITKKHVIINQLYCIAFTHPKDISKKNKININLELILRNNFQSIKSLMISVPKKGYYFLYEHSFEDLNKNYESSNIKNLGIIQNKFDLQKKYSFFLKKLYPEKWENRDLSVAFIEDTFNEVKKQNMPYNIIFNLLEMSYEKTNLFYFILEKFCDDQRKVYFPKSFNVVKYKPFVDLIAEEKKVYIDFDNEKEEIKKGKYIMKIDKLPFYLKIFKETFYRKYDIKNYIKLSEESNFLEIIKKQIISRVITKEDNIDIKIINNVVKIMNQIDEINILLKLFSHLNEILNFIIENFEHLKNIGKNIILHEINEDENLVLIKDLHKIILELEKKNNAFFIDFSQIIDKYLHYYNKNNLNNLIILKEMIMNQKLYGKELKGKEAEINKNIHETGIAIADKLSPYEIIDFIINTDQLNYTKNDLKIIDSINIYILNDKDFNKFYYQIWKKINNKNIEDAIILIFKKIIAIKDIGLIFKLIPYNLFTENAASLLEDLFKNIFYSYNEKACPNILQDIQNILLIFESAKYPPKSFLNFIEEKLTRREINNLYLDIIKNNRISENEHLKNRMIQFLTQKKGLDDIQSLFYVLKNIEIIKNHSFIDEIMSSLDNFIITEDDFYEDQINNKFKLYDYICKLSNRKNLNNNDYNYFKRCRQALNNIINKIKNFEFVYEEVIQIKHQIDQDYFKEKLRILINNNDISNFYNHIKNNIKRFNKIHYELLIALNFYKTFFNNLEKSFIENYIENNIIKLLEINNISFLNEIEEFINKNQKIQKALKNEKIMNSKFFIALFNDCKKKSKEEESQLFDDCINIFCELELLNSWNENIGIEQIPNYEIISEEIASIIKENKKDKKKCEEIIHQELNIIKYTYNNTDNKKQIINMDLPIKLSKSDETKIKNNIIEKSGKEDLKSRNKSIEENLIYLPFLETLKKVLYSIKLLIDVFKVEKTDTYIIIKQMIDMISKDKIITLKKIKDYINLLASNKNIEIDITSFDKKDNNSILVDILALIYNKEEEIKFAFIKKSEEIKALLEFVGETENSKIQIKDILDFINVSDFFDNIISLSIENDNKLIEELKISFQTSPAFGNIVNNYLNNFKEIKNVYEEFSNKPEVSRKKIEQILKHSNIEIFFNNNSRSIEIKGSYTDFLNNDKNFYNKDLQELHDRALLFSNKPFDNISIYAIKDFKEKQEQSKIFVEIVENINILIKYLNDLYIKGYPFSIEVKITIDNFKAFDNRKNDIKNIIENYRNITICLEEAQTEAYKEKPLIRLIFGQQFYNIYRYLNNRSNDNNIIPLLNRISDSKIKKIPNEMMNMNNKNQNNFKSMINEIDFFLKRCLEINKIDIKDIYNKNIIKNEFRQKMRPGFFSWSVDELDFEIQIINLYKKITGNLPLPISLLLCTKETNEEEITSFIYRALLCSFPVLFMIINSDNLELSNAQYLLWILEKLYDRNKRYIYSSLLIIFSDNNSDLRKQLTLLKGHDYYIIGDIANNDINNMQNDYDLNPVEIWSSDTAGVGKSTEIKIEAENSKLNYIYFPIGGSFTRQDIISRIINLEINKDNYEKIYLHIDIYDSDKESSVIIKEFLFNILITRNYSFDEQIFYLGYGSKIVVEIPTGFYEMKDKFKLLNYFKNKKISIEKLPDLRDIKENNYKGKNKITDIQLVANILQMLENNTIQENNFNLDKNNKIIPLDDCQKLINKYFTLEKGNYYQKIAFIHILADQFKKFCTSFYLKPEILLQNERVLLLMKDWRIIYNNNESIIKVRQIMIENLIKLTLYFVKGPYNKIALSQKNTNLQIFGEYNEKKINEIAYQSLSKKDEIISFEKINPSLVFFNEDIQTFSIITTSNPGEPEYNQLLKLYNSQMNVQKNDIKQLIDYRSLSHDKLISEVKNILNLNTLSEEQIRKIIGSYCFTSDNFIKMILILLRIRAGIPIIMMGETGCGKTSLIKNLSALLNKGEAKLKILNIHAGIKDQDIINFIENVNQEVNNGNNNSNDKIWVFFDEINTCNSMGLLSEIFYKHTYYGKKLNNRLTFIGACNPYRLKTINTEKRKEEEQNDYALINEDKNNYNNKQKLVYLVNPLPHSLLTSIFDFGNLSLNDEKKYIYSIVKETLKQYNLSEKIEKIFIDEIILCQNYIRDHNDVSSVSLRELRRFNILFQFFTDYLNNKNHNNDDQLYINSLCLCLYFCYYIRLSNYKLREELKRKINNIFEGKDYFNIIQKEKEFLASKVNIPPGIAKNSTLLENLFSLFVCIVNKIPLIICGKPGTSKSLSFQILYDSMKGERSDNDFFKKYPELLVFSYQGSKTSTSEGVENVFNKARNCLKKNKEKNDIIPVFYFDEMGLAEESPNNPLKVIHSELEYDDNEHKIAFIGISNWILDASKMNRTIFLGVPPLQEKDFHQTAEEISSNIDKELSIKYKDLFIKLVKTYCNYKASIKESEQREFHGLRDFYHLIKNAMNYLLLDKKNKNKNSINREQGDNNQNINIKEISYEIGIKSLLRNFDGLESPFNSFNTIKKIFDEFYKDIDIKKYNNTFNAFDCLKDNINDNNSRYLLIIMESAISIHLLNNIMQELKKNYVFYSGSQMKEDMNKEKYNEKLLNKIQLNLENGDVLVLKNMENIYPSLYNLFNQNFTMLGGKKFARIAFANYQSYSVVNDDFRAILIVDEEQIKQKMEDPPLLNRFEKHMLSYDYLLNDIELKITKKIIYYIDLVLSCNKKNCKIDLKKQILWYSKEEIKGLIFKERYKLKNKDKKIENGDYLYNNILNNLSILFSQDILASMISINSNLNLLKMPKDFFDFYKSHHYSNFIELFQNKRNIFSEMKSTKLIIYTFSKLLEPCIKGNETLVTSLGPITRNNLSEKIINSIKNEKDLEDILEQYYNHKEKKILILKFSEEDLNKMNQIKEKINQFETEKRNNEKYKNIISKKHFIFLIFLIRHKIYNGKNNNKKIIVNDLISNIDEEYTQLFIDNLHGRNDRDIITIMSKKPSEYINEIFDKKNNYLLNIISRIFSYLTYEFKNENLEKQINHMQKNILIDTYIKKIINELYKNEYILNMVKKRIEKEFDFNLNNIIKNIFVQGIFEKNNIEFIDIIYKVISDKIFLLLFKFIFKSEKDHFLGPLLLNYDFIQKEKDNLVYIDKYINDFNFLLVNVVERINSNQILIILDLSFPLSKKWYDSLNSFIEKNIKEEYMLNEGKLRSYIIEEKDVDKELDNYNKIKNDFKNNLKAEIQRIEGLSDLIKCDNINYKKMIYKDFMIIYLREKFEENIEIGIKFLDILIQLRLNLNKDNNKQQLNLKDSFSNIYKEEMNARFDIDNLSKIFIFLICYNDEIYAMLEIFYTLNKYIPNFYNEWKEIILMREVIYEINENFPIYTRIVNESFFIIYESLIKCIFVKPYKYETIQDNIFYEYLNSLQKLSKTAIQIYYKLYLPSKEMYTLEILINIFSSFNSCKNKRNVYNIQEIFVKIIFNILNENIYISQKYYNDLEENYNNLLIILDDLIDKKINEKEYSLLLNNLFIFRFNKSLDNEYRKKISIIYFTDITDNQLYYVLPILKKIIDNIKPLNINDYHNLNEKICMEYFMKDFIKIENNKLELYKIINDKKSDILDLNILYYFESEIELYFKKLTGGQKLNDIKNNEIINYMNNTLSNLSLQYFKKAMSYYLDEIKFPENVNKLGKLYCIAYIKNYLKKLAEFIVCDNNRNILNFEDIFRAFLYKTNNKNILSLKLFLFKCLFNYEKKNYLEFIESIKYRNNIRRLLNHDNFSNLFTININKHSYNYSFINLNAHDYYCNLNKLIDIYFNNFEENQDFNSIADYINKNNNYKGFDLFYNILVNKYILDLYGNVDNKEDNSEKAKILFNKFPKIKINLNEHSITIINYIINKNLFNSKILPKLKLSNNNISLDQLYILLLCIKVVISIQYNRDNLFSPFFVNKSLKNNLISFLNRNYFPGSYPIKNNFIESYYEIENHLNTQTSDNAVYMCSCGKFYTIKPCGYPIEISKCLNCKKNIGGKNHELLRREGHYRIFLNEQAKIKEFNKTFADVNMPYKYLHQFKREIIDPLLSIPSKGVGKMTKENVNKTGNKIRNINELSFRILNFILCSHLLIANILDILDDNDIKNYFSEEISCFGVIIDNWNKIGELLNKNKINNIQAYMNIINENLINIISKYDKNSLKSNDVRNVIEFEIDTFIKQNKDINDKINLYERHNQKMLESSPNNMSSLIQELYSFQYYNNENEYPYLKYLYYYNYPNKDSLFNIIESNNNYKNKYPLTYNMLKYTTDYKSQMEKLRYIPKINKKINHLINNYSYKISRDQALHKKIIDEFRESKDKFIIVNKKNKDEKLDEYLQDLVNLFKSFKNIDLQWDCHKLPKMELTVRESKLATILLDDSEPGYYLSSIYKKLIEYQNLFLENIINCNSQNGLLYCFVKQLNNEIMIQDASINEIVKLNFERNNNLKRYLNIDELIFINTTNNPFTNKFNYELDQIEIELGNIILPGIRKFKATDNVLRYVTYQFEGYRGKNSDILTNFNEKYPPQELNDNEKLILNKYIHDNENDDYKSFLFSIQLLIDYIQKTGTNPNTSISKIIRDIPYHINLSEDIKLFFNNHTEFSVNKLVRIYELFELLCWNQIKDYLLIEYMEKLGEEKIQSINKYYQENPDAKNYIKKIELASAIRKFISRYLAGKRSQSQTNANGMLFYYLNRADLWVRNIDDDNFEKELYKLSALKITVGEGKDFYDILGGDSKLLNLNFEDKNSINNINGEENEGIQKNDIHENEEEGMNDNQDDFMLDMHRRRLF